MFPILWAAKGGSPAGCRGDFCIGGHGNIEQHKWAERGSPGRSARPDGRQLRRHISILRWEWLKYKHGIPVAEESVSFPDRLSIHVKDPVAAGGEFSGCGKGANEHEQRAAGEVKIREHPIYHEKSSGRMDIDPGAPGGGGESKGLHGMSGILRSPRSRFEDSHRGRADRDDPSAFPSGGGDGVGGLPWQLVALFVHGMMFDRLGLHRRKRAMADVQRYFTDQNAPIFQLLD